MPTLYLQFIFAALAGWVNRDITRPAVDTGSYLGLL